MRAAGAVGMVVLTLASGGAACSSFGSAPSTADVFDGGTEPGSDASSDALPPAAPLDGGCGVPPFATRITGAEPADDGWDYDVAYGPQGELSVTRIDEGDGVLRATILESSGGGRGKVYVREIDAAEAQCVGFEMKLRVPRFPEKGLSILSSTLRFASDVMLAIALAPGSWIAVVQQIEGGAGYRSLARTRLVDDQWHVIRVGYAAGPVVEASIDGVPMPVDQAEVLPFSAPTRFDVGVTFAPPESFASFDIDEVSLF